MRCAKAYASPGVPPACPLDYCAISPHALAESLGDIRASISHTAAPTRPPTTAAFCFASRSHCKKNKLLQSVSVYACTHHFFFFFFSWKLIRITITGMWLESCPLPVAEQWEGELSHVFLKGHTPLYSSRCVNRGKSPCVLLLVWGPVVFMQRRLAEGFLDHTVYFRNNPHEIPQLRRTFL